MIVTLQATEGYLVPGAHFSGKKLRINLFSFLQQIDIKVLQWAVYPVGAWAVMDHP